MFPYHLGPSSDALPPGAGSEGLSNADVGLARPIGAHAVVEAEHADGRVQPDAEAVPHLQVGQPDRFVLLKVPRPARVHEEDALDLIRDGEDRKSTRLNSSHVKNSYAVFCLKKKI